jgi:hypothetical protein
MASAAERIEGHFPGLRGKDWRITSGADSRYNCIGWAVGDTARRWWPADAAEGFHWPEGLERTETLAAFMAMFALVGYAPCNTAEAAPGQEKVALFCLNGTPTHAARQLPGGRWTSKLGRWEDIEHDLQDLCGETYGSVAQVMRRRVGE